MWVKKTKEEEKRDSYHSKCKKIIGVIGVMIFGVIISSFFRGWAEAATCGSYLVPSDEVMGRLPGSLRGVGLIGIIFLTIYLICRATVSTPPKSVMLCPRCEAAKDDDGNYDCSCGGRVVDIKTMKWIEDKPTAHS